MSIYQFLIAVRSAGDGHASGQLTNDAGEVTSHLTGMLYRTIRMLEAGIKPVFVFDGKAPTMKSGELAKRKERQKAAEEELTKLQETGGSAEDIERFARTHLPCPAITHAPCSAITHARGQCRPLPPRTLGNYPLVACRPVIVRSQQKRTVRASREQSEEVKMLLKLMGVPVLDAPCEAEATVRASACPSWREHDPPLGRPSFVTPTSGR